jgi:hypothetical protein
MNIPVKILKNQVMNDNYSFLQSLAKKYHKSSTRSRQLAENVPLLNSLEHNTFKDDVINWVFSLSIKDRIKALSIENKWLATMVHQMFLKFKHDNKTKFQIKNEAYNDEELFFSQYLGGLNNQAYLYSSANDLVLENYFNVKNEQCK